MSAAPTVVAFVGDVTQNGNFENLNVAINANLNGPVACATTLGVGGAVTGFPVTGVFNGSGTSVVNAKIWVGTVATTGGQATFYPTTTGTSAGTALFTTLLTVQAIPVLQTGTGSKIPVASIYSASTTSIVINAIVAYSGSAVANGTYVTCMVIGT